MDFNWNAAFGALFMVVGLAAGTVALAALDNSMGDIALGCAIACAIAIFISVGLLCAY